MAKLPLGAGGKERKIKMSYLNKNISDYMFKKPSFKFRYEEIFEYSPPYEDDVPENWYYAKIFDIREHSTGYKQYITVYYDIFSKNEKRKFENGSCRQMLRHKICIDYVMGTTQYAQFASAMRRITGYYCSESHKIFKNVILLFRVEYKRKNEIGKTNCMQETDLHEDWFDENLINEDYQDSVPMFSYLPEVNEDGDYI